MPLSVLVVDDTSLFRKVVSRALSDIPDTDIIGYAKNGKEALEEIKRTQPDLVTLDIEMPEMSGLEVLEELKRQNSNVGVIVVSAFTSRGSDLTIKALEKGAFDFVTKASGRTIEESIAAIKRRIEPIVLAYRKKLEKNLTAKGGDIAPLSRIAVRGAGAHKPEMVVLGISTGGPNALSTMLPKIPSDIGVPIFIVQHMPPLFTHSLAISLSEKCKIQVKEAEHGEVAVPSCAYIAPGGKQMKILADALNKKIINITDDPAENNCRPSVDYLFRSIANNFPGLAVGVIMTGMGGDGTLGLKLIKRHGGLVIAQDAESCVVYGMPKEAIKAGVVDVVSPLDKIADEITKAVKGKAVK